MLPKKNKLGQLKNSLLLFNCKTAVLLRHRSIIEELKRLSNRWGGGTDRLAKCLASSCPCLYDLHMAELTGSSFAPIPDKEEPIKETEREEVLAEVVKLQPFIRSMVRKRMENGPDVDQEDLVQETLRLAIKNIEQLREKDKLRAWLAITTQNVINQHYRDKKKEGFHIVRGAWDVGSKKTDSQEKEAQGGIENVPDPRSIGEGKVLNLRFDETNRKKLEEAIEKLDPKYKEVTKFWLEELPLLEICDRLGLSLETVKLRLYRARKFLAGRLGVKEFRLRKQPESKSPDALAG